ncbi:anti-sigma factor family protein [Desulforamulus ruminis]|uniref:Anti-sigma-W factor RsiW n=1 Tax=Desulforamulus ruminis (strain ATCC 23193 / DSM 2154 / NCIMB 8452 / DL) TaxID=696281 RepID=F6DUG4_DESRL|nr:zf-HC2 domain-containing protein [Desulforamulus ruminis]AEG59031.1 hypothetical protein Desru_0748 [Desulforamulus ruminis DSM 2154]
MNQTCLWIKKNLAAYGDHQLTPEDQTRIDKHLKHCPECQAYWQEQQALNHWLDNLVMEEPPPELTGQIMTAIESLPPVRNGALQVQEYSWWDFTLRSFLLLLTGTTVLLVSVWIYLEQRYGWLQAAGLIRWKMAKGWEQIWNTVDLWYLSLLQWFYHTWNSAVNWPASSGTSLLQGIVSVREHFASHQGALGTALIILVIWILLTLITAHLGSRIIFNRGEERTNCQK